MRSTATNTSVAPPPATRVVEISGTAIARSSNSARLPTITAAADVALGAAPGQAP
jgi:hypothetical protein